MREHFPAAVVRLPAQSWPDSLSLPAGAVRRDGQIELFTDQVAPVLKELERVGAEIQDLRVSAPNLEDLFLKLTGHALRS